jgi:hypothetical protein
MHSGSRSRPGGKNLPRPVGKGSVGCTLQAQQVMEGMAEAHLHQAGIWDDSRKAAVHVKGALSKGPPLPALRQPCTRVVCLSRRPSPPAALPVESAHVVCLSRCCA